MLNRPSTGSWAALVFVLLMLFPSAAASQSFYGSLVSV